MRRRSTRPSFPVWMGAVSALILCSTASAVGAQEVERLPDDALTEYADAFLDIADAREEFQQEMGRTHDENGQTRLRNEFAATVGEILEAHEMAQDEYDRITALVSHDEDHRTRFETILTRLREARSG